MRPPCYRESRGAPPNKPTLPVPPAPQDEDGILRSEVRAAFAGTHTIKWVSETKVELTDKNNQDEVMACCCSGVVQNFMWGIDFADGVATVKDELDDFNRINTNLRQMNQVSIETIKINSMAAQIAMSIKIKENAGGASNPAVVTVACVVPDIMSRDEPKVDDIATQLEKLNGLKESGALSEEEYAAAKAKALAAA